MSTPLDLTTLSRELARDASGIWTTASQRASSVSYPDGGHDACFALEDSSFWFAHRNECISRALGRFPFAGPFLDVGGGNGAVSKRLAADGIDTVVLEPGASGASNARRRGLPNVIRATLAEAAFAPASFGAAGLFDVIEHVEDDARILGDVHRVLRPRGVLCVTVPAYAWLWSAEDDQAGHFRRYTLSRLGDLLAQSGFEPRYLTYFFAPLTVPLFFLRSVRYRLSQPVRGDAQAAARQHAPSRVVRAAVDRCLAPELLAIGRGGTIPFGTSCLAIALAR